MIWQEPARGDYPEPSTLGLPGVDALRAFLRRGGPVPPIARLTGLRPTEFAVGAATFTMPATGWLASAAGPIPGGALGLPGDAALGSAVQSGLPAGTPYTTSELSMSFLRPPRVDAGLFVARGRLIHGGRRLALSEATITDGTGRLIGHATSRCFVFDAISPLPDPPDVSEPYVMPPHETPDPWERPPRGEVLGWDIWQGSSGLEIMRGLATGDLPSPPLFNLIGIRPAEPREGTCSVVLPLTEWLASPIRSVQGGFLVLLADLSVGSAVQTTCPAGTVFATVDIKVNFIRPVYPEGGEVVAHATVVHRGRNLAIARVEIVMPNGKLAAVATGTAHLLPGRTWAFEPPGEPS